MGIQVRPSFEHSCSTMGKEGKEKKVVAADGDKDEEMAEFEMPPVLYKSPLASPLIADKVLARSMKLLKKAVSEKQIRRGVPEVTKAIRKGLSGLVFIAGDIHPMDVFAHVPICCEEKSIPYCFVASRHVLGAGCQTKRPISIVMVMKPKDDSTYQKSYEQVENALKLLSAYG